MIWLTILTHLVAFAAGAVTVRVLTAKAATIHTNPEDHPVKPSSPPSPPFRLPKVAVLILVAALFVVGLGVQQQGYQSDRRERDACVAAWATGTTDALDTRVRAGTKVTKAQASLYEASRTLLDVLSRLASDPPEAGNGDLVRARVAYGAAARRVAAAQDRVTAVREATPYPTLDCQG